MEVRLRRNRIRAGGMPQFLESWLAQVPDLRRRFGFEVVGAWVIEGEDTFVWLLRYDGPDTFDAADARYYESAERSSLDPDPAAWFESAEEARLRPVFPPPPRRPEQA
jgi:hypothetical protein